MNALVYGMLTYIDKGIQKKLSKRLEMENETKTTRVFLYIKYGNEAFL